MTVITPEQIRQAALKVYREVGPDYTYKDVVPEWNPNTLGAVCRYVVNDDNGQRVPGCIVGRILFEAGVPVKKLESIENDNAMNFMTNLAIAGWWEGTQEHVEIDAALLRAQQHQDQAGSWREAIATSGLVTDEMLKEN